MIKGIGTDIVHVARIKELIDKHDKRFLKKILSEEEIEKIPKVNGETYVSGRFAVKESLVKALNNREIVYSEITINNEESGKPFVKDVENIILKYGIKNMSIIHISISHEKEYATAFVIIE